MGNTLRRLAQHNVSAMMSDSSASQLNVLCLIYEGDSMIDHDPIVTNYGPFMTEEPTRGDDIDLQDQQAPLNACLDALLYQDGEARSLTQRSLDLIAASTKKLDRKHDSFIRFLRWFGHDRLRSKHISYDEVEVCEHPLHPYFIGECCRTALRHKAEHLVKSVKYYVQALQGGCAWGHMGIYYKYADDANASMRDPAKGLRYLLDTESEGNVIGRVFDSIGDHYIQGNGCDQDPTLALTFYQRAVDLGHLPAYVSLSIMLWRGQRGYPADKNRALLTLLDAEKKGVSVKDDRILEKLILRLIDGLPRHSAQLLGEFKNVGELVLHYCDVLIQRGSHIGYRLKGEVYQYGHAGIAIDEAKAIAIWEEADKVGLATHYIYCHYLIPAYMGGDVVRKDGKRVLEYCNKALELTGSDLEEVQVNETMGDVYRTGIRPVEQDEEKALEYYKEALKIGRQESRADYIFVKIRNICKKLGHNVPDRYGDEPY